MYCTVLYCTCMSRWNQVEFHSEYEGRQMGRTRSGYTYHVTLMGCVNINYR